jgi:hypothetical protein
MNCGTDEQINRTKPNRSGRVGDKMADSVVCKGSSLGSSDDRLSEKNGDTCLYCNELSSETPQKRSWKYLMKK